MRTVNETVLKGLKSITRDQLERVHTEFNNLFYPFEEEERLIWQKWISHNQFGASNKELILVIEDLSLKLPFRSRALLLLLSPIWMSDIEWLPWKWREDVFLFGETRVLRGSEDYRDSQGTPLLSSDDKALVALALSFIDGFRDAPLSFIEGTILSHNIFRRQLLSILPEESPLASKTFDEYRYFDFELSRERHCLDHVLTPFEQFLTEKQIAEKWKLEADKKVWTAVEKEKHHSKRKYELWEKYLKVVRKGLDVRMDLGDGELSGNAYPLHVFKQQLENIWSISPIEFRDEQNAVRFLDAFSKNKKLRPFGCRLFMEIINSEEKAFSIFSGAQSMCLSWKGMAGAVLDDVIKKLGKSHTAYTNQLIQWFEFWEEKQQKALSKHITQQQEEVTRVQALREAMKG